MISSAAPGSSGPIATILPSSIAMSAASPRTTRSGMTLLQKLDKSNPAIERGGYIAGQNRFIGMMANAAGAAQEQHRGGHAPRNNHGIVAGAARHAMNLEPGALDGALQHLCEARIHCDGRLIQARLPAGGETAGSRDLLGASQQPRY